MSIPVELATLAERIEEFGPVAYLVTVGAEGEPHIVSVQVRWEGAALVVGAGRHTSANVERAPRVTLLWPARPGGGYSLILDGRAAPGPSAPGATPCPSAPGATSGGPTLAIEPSAAVLHRTPEGDPSAPSYITVLAAR